MKAPKYTKSVCIGGLGLLAAASLIAAALPVSAQAAETAADFERANGLEVEQATVTPALQPDTEMNAEHYRY